MKKYQIALSLLFITAYLLSLYVSNESLKKSRDVKLTDIDIKVVDIRKKLSIDMTKFSHSTYKLWGLKISKILKNRVEKNKLDKLKSSNKFDNISKINILNRKICIKERCWIFMGIIGIGNEIKVTLLSTEKKQKLETFMVGDELLKNLVIRKIMDDRMVLTDKRNKQEFFLKLFEVNASIYLPKRSKGKL
jgi:hypothetical protein